MKKYSVIVGSDGSCLMTSESLAKAIGVKKEVVDKAISLYLDKFSNKGEDDYYVGHFVYDGPHFEKSWGMSIVGVLAILCFMRGHSAEFPPRVIHEVTCVFLEFYRVILSEEWDEEEADDDEVDGVRKDGMEIDEAEFDETMDKIMEKLKDKDKNK